MVWGPEREKFRLMSSDDQKLNFDIQIGHFDIKFDINDCQQPHDTGLHKYSAPLHGNALCVTEAGSSIVCLNYTNNTMWCIKYIVKN